MRKLLIISKKVGKVVLGLVVLLIITLVTATLFSKKDYGTPSTKIGGEIEKLALTNVNIVSIVDNDSVLTDKTILIENGRIKSIIEDFLDVPDTYTVVNLKGKYIAPGLIDMHTHIFDRSDLPMYLGYGVTTVRNMMGFPMHLRWREQVKANEYPGPELITAAPTINSGGNGSPFHKNIVEVQEGIDAVKEYKELGYDFIKIYGGLNEEQLEGIMGEAVKNDLFVAGHPPKDIALADLLKYDIKSYEHVEEMVQSLMDYELDTILGRKVAKELKQGGAKMTLTLSPFHNIYKATLEGDDFLNTIPKEKINPFVRLIGKRQLGEWVDTNEGAYKWNKEKYECMESLTRILYEEDVELLLGTDTGPSLTVPGITLHDEIELLKNAGIPNLDILRSGTINAARALGKIDELGSIEKGKRANLIVLEANPIDDMSSLREPLMILNNGMVYDREAILKLRKLGSDKSNLLMTIGRFVDHMYQK